MRCSKKPTESELLGTGILVTDAALLILAFGAALLSSRRLAVNAEAQAQAVWVFFGFGLTIIPTLIIYLSTAASSAANTMRSASWPAFPQ